MSSQSETNDYIFSLQLAQKYLFQCAGLLMLALGTISCFLNWIVFNRKTLRKNPCSIYMTAVYTINFIYIATLMISSILSVGFGITSIIRTLGLCRFYMYMAYVLDSLSPGYLILASVDRLLITSPHARTRQRSTCRLAFISITCMTAAWLLFHTHALVLSNVIQLGPNVFICYTFDPTYLTAIGYYALTKSIAIPSLLIALGVLTVRNVRKLSLNRAAPESSGNTASTIRAVQASHHKDRQLVRIILADIGIYVLCTYPQAGFHVYLQITQGNMKNTDQLQVDAFIQYLFAVVGFIPYCVGLYSNLIVSKTFRNEVKSIILCK